MAAPVVRDVVKAYVWRTRRRIWRCSSGRGSPLANVKCGAAAPACATIRRLPDSSPRKARDQFRYGIGEWYGRSFVHLTASERQHYANLQSIEKAKRPEQPCPFRSTPGRTVPCTKAGGVCSLRLYRRSQAGTVSAVPDAPGQLCTTCPNRFLQNRTIFEWIGETILGSRTPLIATEVGFLERPAIGTEAEANDDVGRIDHVLVHPDAEPMRWCALEIQAVYFSGLGMNAEFEALRNHDVDELPFPSRHRRPDYRSSGPKRLMPQLQIKVPSLRRWGKKMAVVVDQSFFSALGQMDEASHISNCDIAWFVVRYDETGEEAVLTRSFVRLTTLERSVEGLTGGYPVSLPLFEGRIRAKLPKHPDDEATPDLSR